MSKLEQSLEQVNQATYDIDTYNELDEMGRGYLLDEMIDVMEDLKQKDTSEGWHYNEMTQLVKKGEDIPQPFTTIKVASALSEEVYTVKVKTITGMRWNSNGDLVVDFLGRKTK